MDKDASEKIRVVEIEEEPIELYKILKFESMVQSGGEAKHVIAEGLVRVNGEIETRKSRKIIVENSNYYQVENFFLDCSKGNGPRLMAQGKNIKKNLFSPYALRPAPYALNLL
jgi:ribosome-associated protein